jgi:hypothetical protein
MSRGNEQRLLAIDLLPLEEVNGIKLQEMIAVQPRGTVEADLGLEPVAKEVLLIVGMWKLLDLTEGTLPMELTGRIGMLNNDNWIVIGIIWKKMV